MVEDSGGWASPSGSGDRDEPPRWGQRVEGWTPPAPAGPQPAAPAPGWTPPPKRGLVPLHPLGFGQLLGAAFGVIRWNPKATILPALVVAIVQQAVTLAFLFGIGVQAFDRIQRAPDDAVRQQIIAGAVGGGVIAALVIVAISLFGSALLQGVLVDVVASAVTGGRPSVGRALRTALHRMWPLIGIALLIGAAEVVVAAALVLLVLLVAQAGVVGIVVAVLVALIGGLGLLAGVLFIVVKFATAPSAVVLEGRGVFSALGRSWRLTRGSFWRVLGLVVVVNLMVALGAQIVSIPFTLVGSAVTGLLAPDSGGTSTDIGSLITGSLPSAIVTTIVAGIGQIAQVAVVVMVYLDLRMRREGLDLELQRYVEQGGQDPLEPVR